MMKLFLLVTLLAVNLTLGSLIKADLNGENDIKDEHFQLNFKSNTPDRMISHEMNEQRFYKPQTLTQQITLPLTTNDLLNHYHTLQLSKPQYFPKFYLKYQIPKQQQQAPQKLLNFHYHKNLGMDRMPSFDSQYLTQQKQSSLRKLLPVQFVQLPVQQNEADLFDQTQSGIQYNMMHLKLENVPQLGSLLTGEINNNGQKKPILLTNDFPNVLFKKIIKKAQPSILFKRSDEEENDVSVEDEGISRTKRSLDEEASSESELNERADIDLNDDSDNSFYYPNSDTKLNDSTDYKAPNEI